MLNPFKIISKFIRSGNQKNIDNLKSIVEKVNQLENEISKLSDDEFPKKTSSLKERVRKGENIENRWNKIYRKKKNKINKFFKNDFIRSTLK